MPGGNFKFLLLIWKSTIALTSTVNIAATSASLAGQGFGGNGHIEITEVYSDEQHVGLFAKLQGVLAGEIVVCQVLHVFEPHAVFWEIQLAVGQGLVQRGVHFVNEQGHGELGGDLDSSFELAWRDSDGYFRDDALSALQHEIVALLDVVVCDCVFEVHPHLHAWTLAVYLAQNEVLLGEKRFRVQVEPCYFVDDFAEGIVDGGVRRQMHVERVGLPAHGHLHVSLETVDHQEGREDPVRVWRLRHQRHRGRPAEQCVLADEHVDGRAWCCCRRALHQVCVHVGSAVAGKDIVRSAVAGSVVHVVCEQRACSHEGRIQVVCACNDTLHHAQLVLLLVGGGLSRRQLRGGVERGRYRHGGKHASGPAAGRRLQHKLLWKHQWRCWGRARHCLSDSL